MVCVMVGSVEQLVEEGLWSEVAANFGKAETSITILSQFAFPISTIPRLDNYALLFNWKYSYVPKAIR